MRRTPQFLAVLLVSLCLGTPAPSAEIPMIGVEDPAVSPDGRSLAIIHAGRVLVIGMETGEVIRAPAIGEVQERPTWSPDGSEIAFGALVDDRFRLFTIPSSGGDAREIPATSGVETHARTPSWGGDRIVFVSQALDGTAVTMGTGKVLTFKNPLWRNNFVPPKPETHSSGVLLGVSRRNQEFHVRPLI